PRFTQCRNSIGVPQWAHPSLISSTRQCWWISAPRFTSFCSSSRRWRRRQAASALSVGGLALSTWIFFGLGLARRVLPLSAYLTPGSWSALSLYCPYWTCIRTRVIRYLGLVTPASCWPKNNRAARAWKGPIG